ncbi:MAG: hypothetical protein ACUVXI_20150 [bacterium]
MIEEDKKKAEDFVKGMVGFIDFLTRRAFGIIPLPEEFVKHIRGAQREVLLAVRGLIDGAIDILDRLEKEEEEGPKGGPAKKVEVR